MRFDNCKDCKKYKYIQDNGLCPSCLNGGSVRIRLDIIDESLRSPEILHTIADTMNSVSDVNCDGAAEFSSDKHDDLDLKEDHCRLFEAEAEFKYKDYNGNKKSQVRSAMIDALKEAKDQYN